MLLGKKQTLVDEVIFDMDEDGKNYYEIPTKNKIKMEHYLKVKAKLRLHS